MSEEMTRAERYQALIDEKILGPEDPEEDPEEEEE